MPVADGSYHGGIKEMKGHLRQFSNDNRKGQVNGFIGFGISPMAHHPGIKNLQI
jgi:hypothetical protein